MFTQRHTAYKFRIKDLLINEFVQREGESDYVLVGDKQVSRVRLMGTIVNKYVNDERKSGTLVIDDGSETIRAKVWEDDFELVNKARIGALIDLVGRVRMYNDEIYLTPELIKEVSPNWFVVRKLELKNKSLIKGSQTKEEIINELSEEQGETIDEKEDSTPKPDDNLINQVLERIKSSEGGAPMDSLVELVGGKSECQAILKHLLENDMIFEPRAGNYKAL